MTASQAQPLHPVGRHGRDRTAFTLTEVMISIALVLIIILGVNQVFSLANKAISGGMALGEINRNIRDAQHSLGSDLKHADTRFFFIESEVLPAFRNRDDQQGDLDFRTTLASRTLAANAIRTIDRDNNNSEADAADLTPVAILTKRTHRSDQLKFFTRNMGSKQTGDVGTNTFASTLSSEEHFICISHLQQPSFADLTSGTLTGRELGIGSLATAAAAPLTPVNTSNNSNFYATDWVLGRNDFLLREPRLIGGAFVIPDVNNNRLTYIGRGNGATATGSGASLSPFSKNSSATVNGTAFPGTFILQHSVYDLMGMSLERYLSDVLTPYTTTTGSGGDANPTNPAISGWAENRFDYRCTGFPTPNRPLTPAGAARTVPCFVPHCTQFAVEFAGDFLSQDASGAVTGFADNTGGGTDGVIDYIVGAGGKRTIRWYGFPRDADGDGKIIAANDVVPLRDLMGTPPPFERQIATTLPMASNYGQPTAVGIAARYIACWGPDCGGFPRPELIRIIMAIDDPASRVGAEQTFEFIFELPSSQ